MNLELLELVVTEQAAAAAKAAVVKFEAPVAVLAGQLIAAPWSGDAKLEVGTEGDPARFGSYKIAAGRRTPLDQHRLVPLQ